MKVHKKKISCWLPSKRKVVARALIALVYMGCVSVNFFDFYLSILCVRPLGFGFGYVLTDLVLGVCMYVGCNLISVWSVLCAGNVSILFLIIHYELFIVLFFKHSGSLT